MSRLARAGTAFCVHAVHVYGLEYRLAEADVERTHCDSIAQLHCRHASSTGGGERKSHTASANGPSGDSSAAATAVTTDESRTIVDGVGQRSSPTGGCGSGCGSDNESIETAAAEIARLREFVATRFRNANMVRIPYTRGDCMRQADMSARWGADARDWPLANNLCGRRVSALYLDALYRTSTVDADVTGRPPPAGYGDDGDGDGDDDEDEKKDRVGGDQGEGDGGGGGGGSSDRGGDRNSSSTQKRIYVRDSVVVEHRNRDAGASELRSVLSCVQWWDIMLVHPRARVLARLAATDERESEGYRAEATHNLLSGMMKAITAAERQSVVTRIHSHNAARYPSLHSTLLPFAVLADGRAWMPFDVRRSTHVCRLCGRSDVRRESGYEMSYAGRVHTVSGDSYCVDCLGAYGEAKNVRPAWGKDAKSGGQRASEAAPRAKQPNGQSGHAGGGRRSSPAGVGGGDDADEQLPTESIADIRRRAAARTETRDWCAPLRDADTHIGASGVYGMSPKSVTDGRHRGLVRFGADY